jgi:hypothetical protein
MVSRKGNLNHQRRMSDTQKPNAQISKELLPHFLIVGGIVLTWLGIDPVGWVMCAGFITYGILGLQRSLSKPYSGNFFVRLIKPVSQILVIIVAINYLVTGTLFLILMMLILLDVLISVKGSEPITNADRKS